MNQEDEIEAESKGQKRGWRNSRGKRKVRSERKVRDSIRKGQIIDDKLDGCVTMCSNVHVTQGST